MMITQQFIHETVICSKRQSWRRVGITPQPLSFKTVDVNWLYIHPFTLTVFGEFWCPVWLHLFLSVSVFFLLFCKVCLVIPRQGILNPSNTRQESALMHDSNRSGAPLISQMQSFPNACMFTAAHKVTPLTKTCAKSIQESLRQARELCLALPEKSNKFH